MRILVTGVKGQLGFDICEELSKRGYSDFRGIDIADLDITDEEAVNKYILEYKPDVVMHNAAWTAVDKAEENYELVYRVNALGPKFIADACKKIDAKMVYISTDYVFDGTKNGIYEVDDKPNPVSTYGSTKLDGEKFVKEILDKYFIVRISWVFGKNGNNFIKTMLKLASMGKNELDVVNDQVGSPTYTKDLAILLCDMIETDKYGIYHATNEGFCSWYEFAQKVFEVSSIDMKVNPIHTKDYLLKVSQQAKRPMNSKMSKDSLTKAGFKHLPSWEDALERYLKELKDNG
ncbi:MAG: dTDP-4-dehydrorhamnose reductase [Bacilli bacterium]|nr:dTDP-4-dehydrorhamnose reductase [Bacilli bacterium]